MGEKAFLDIKDTYCLRGIAMLMIIVGHTYNGYPVAIGITLADEPFGCTDKVVENILPCSLH